MYSLVYMLYTIGFGKNSFLFLYFEAWSDWNDLFCHYTLHIQKVSHGIKKHVKKTVLRSLTP